MEQTPNATRQAAFKYRQKCKDLLHEVNGAMWDGIECQIAYRVSLGMMPTLVGAKTFPIPLGLAVDWDMPDGAETFLKGFASAKGMSYKDLMRTLGSAAVADIRDRARSDFGI